MMLNTGVMGESSVELDMLGNAILKTKYCKEHLKILSMIRLKIKEIDNNFWQEVEIFKKSNKKDKYLEGMFWVLLCRLEIQSHNSKWKKKYWKFQSQISQLKFNIPQCI